MSDGTWRTALQFGGQSFTNGRSKQPGSSCRRSKRMVVVFPLFYARFRPNRGFRNAEPVSIPVRNWPPGRPDLWGHVRARQLVRSETARDHDLDPTGQIRQTALTMPGTARVRSARPTDATLIELFLDMLAAERGAGKHTLAAYGRDLADFSAQLAETGRTLGNATTEHVRGYLRHLSETGFAASSVARRLSAIRQLYRFLYAEGRRGDDPAAIIEGPKRGRSIPKVLGIEAVDRLLEAARGAPA